MNPSEQELIEKAKQGDKYAFGELFDRYRNKILGYLYRYMGDYQAAEDLTITTFMNAYNNLAHYTEMGTFSSWLYKIATNCAKNELEKKGRRKENSLDEVADDEKENRYMRELMADEDARPDHLLMKKELKELIYKVVAKLEKKYKEVLFLCDVEGLKYREAAKVLKCNPMTIGTRLKHARDILSVKLKKYRSQL